MCRTKTVQSPVRTLGSHHELFAVAGECGRQSVMGQRGAGEIAEDICRRCLLHSLGVMRILPAFGLRRMATGASLGPGEFGACLHLGFRIGRMDKRHDDDTYDAECDAGDDRHACGKIQSAASRNRRIFDGPWPFEGDIRPFTRSRVDGARA